MRRKPSVPLVPLVALLLGAPIGGLAFATADAPVPLGETASAPARLAAPTPPPFSIPDPTGQLELAESESMKRVEDRVAAGKPTAYRFQAAAGRMLTFGISSPRGDVRISIYDVAKKVYLGGTRPEDGAIRCTTSFSVATELLLIAHTAGAETPFRFDVNAGAGSM